MLTEAKILLGYLLVAILTFGHAAGNYECTQEPGELSVFTCEEHTVHTAMFSAIFWPFYWSWEVFE